MMHERRRTALIRASALGIALSLAACAETQVATQLPKTVSDSGRIGSYKIGKPYQIAGTWYYPKEDYDYSEEGVASWYGPGFHGKSTANGEDYDQNAITAAHRTLPMPSLVRVTNLENGRSIVVRVNDRGPYAKERILDMSRRSAQLLGFVDRGTARVKVEILPEESRALKEQAIAGKGIGDDGPTVVAAPRGAVASESLDPPPGSASSAGTATGSTGEVSTGENAPGKPFVRLPPSTASQTAAVQPSQPAQPVAQVVKVNTYTSPNVVASGGTWVQAGAFSDRANAEKVRQQLQGVHAATISSVSVNGRELYRVRLGPLRDTSEAERILAQVQSRGIPQAKIVSD